MMWQQRNKQKTVYSLTSFVYNDTEIIVRTEHNKYGLVLIAKKIITT